MLLRGRDAADVLCGRNPPRLLAVPGGFARRKLEALGPEGVDAVRRFVASGGAYLGICGGAGLALSDPDGLSLCPWRRAGFRNRLKHFISGHVGVTPDRGSPLVPGWLADRPLVPVWWPARFAPPVSGMADGVLAAYDGPGPDFMLADLALGGLPEGTLDAWRERYGIGIGTDFPGEGPCMLAGRFGRGRVVLSHAHLETPDSPQANAWLAHILDVLTGGDAPGAPSAAVAEWRPAGRERLFGAPELNRACAGLEEVIELGVEHRLLYRRSPWLLGWRPGTPGFAVSNLRAMLHQVAATPASPRATAVWREHGAGFSARMEGFLHGVAGYFLAERLAATLARFDREAVPEAALARERLELFGPPPGVGGACGRLLAVLDELAHAQLAG